METVQVGDKTLPVDRIENGVPVIQAWGEEIPNANGGQDVIIHVPCLGVNAQAKQP